MNKLCSTCGTQYPENFNDELCPICNEERQYIPLTGQAWTTHVELLTTHKTKVVKIRENLFEILITPRFAIGQRALFVVSEQGNILWDCVSLLDENAINFLASKGGLKAIAFSHPHYYSNVNQWAEKFDCPIYIHQYDEPYIYYKNELIVLWSGSEYHLWDNIKLVNIGGHFDGSSVIMIPNFSPKGTILCGDTLYLSLNKKHFSVMYSYPNRIPLSLSEVKKMKKRLDALEFDTIYGFYSYQNVLGNAKEVLSKSLLRYC